jgi:hypothetical protein
MKHLPKPQEIIKVKKVATKLFSFWQYSFFGSPLSIDCVRSLSQECTGRQNLDPV